jgi:hypothetical protein
MKSTIARVFDMLQRVHRCILENPIAPELPRASAARLEIIAIISALSVAAKNQVGGRQESTGGVQRRETCWRALRRYLAQINHTARTLEPEHPGIRPTFRLPRTRSYPALLAAARSIIAAATPLKSSFLACGLPKTFLEDVTTLLADFEAATTQKLGGKITQVASTAELKEQAARGILAATKLDACMRNHFRHNPEVLAAWKHARHIERTPSRSSATPSTTSVPSVPSVPQILSHKKSPSEPDCIGPSPKPAQSSNYKPTKADTAGTATSSPKSAKASTGSNNRLLQRRDLKLTVAGT